MGVAALALAATAAGCGEGVPLEPPQPVPEAAVALLHGTRGHEVSGVVRFERGEDGLVEVDSDVSGLEPGEHAYHVHVYGDCSAPDASSAGPHFNFVGRYGSEPGEIDRITGNLGELVADGDGRAVHGATVRLAELAGPTSIVGRAVVVHERGNDPDAPPGGDAGARIACGVIGIASASGADAG